LALVGAGVGCGLIAFATMQYRKPPVIEPPARAPAPAHALSAKAESSSQGEPTSPDAEPAKPPLSSPSAAAAAVDALKPPRNGRRSPLLRDGGATPSPVERTAAPPHDPLADPD
jgi:hypothetical protein